MSGTNWDERFMSLAHTIAAWSKEHGRKVGAVIVDTEREVRSTGYNGFPRGVNDDLEERHSRETGEKYFWSSHAERNAIYNAARTGIALKGCTIYIPWYPCGECAKGIIQSGITRIVCYEPDFKDPRWGSEFRKVQTMLKEGGVVVDVVAKLQDLNGS
jgi:dCMP deaminase